ncbi:hypothetical protein A3C37_02080 [Candidatus Peribacteria bacterium RIFCSPHIGHO2_02_FULL_53_20]|nr:MAG: hypothetical protein A3C37_02080 [Candidatus Peribacteria bacterium RIFCSPHIGHO2_02_FULL_53_20]
MLGKALALEKEAAEESAQGSQTNGIMSQDSVSGLNVHVPIPKERHVCASQGNAGFAPHSLHR